MRHLTPPGLAGSVAPWDGQDGWTALLTSAAHHAAMMPRYAACVPLRQRHGASSRRAAPPIARYQYGTVRPGLLRRLHTACNHFVQSWPVQHTTSHHATPYHSWHIIAHQHNHIELTITPHHLQLAHPHPHHITAHHTTLHRTTSYHITRNSCTTAWHSNRRDNKDNRGQRQQETAVTQQCGDLAGETTGDNRTAEETMERQQRTTE
jgi:hypothetical protein